ncbi:retrovirus-related pol polyprotein from transposon TNT 1-94 [Tanacetum coccineum]
MDLCGPMRVESINGKKYVLVIVDDYSRYTWTHFLRSKDETPGVLIDFLTLVQRGLHAQVTTVRTDKGTEFLNKNLHAYFAKEGIRHEMSIARTPEQNGVVKRRNCTLVEAARTMLSAVKVPLFFWAEAIATTCFTQNRSLVDMRKHLIISSMPRNRQSSSFTSLSKAYGYFNKRKECQLKTIHVNFARIDLKMASDHEKLHQFDRLDVWELVDRPLCKNVINLKWLWKNKHDEENTVIRNKSFLVTKGYAQKEGIDFEGSFAPSGSVGSCMFVDWYAEHNIIYRFTSQKLIWSQTKPQGVVLIELSKLPGYHPNKVYRLKKALYGLKQAPRAWYDELSNFLVSEGFSKGELKFFLGIQIHQSSHGIFINQAKYAQEILKNHGMTSCDSIGTLMATKHLDVDLSGTPVDQTKYCSMVKAIMYLTTSRRDIVHATCYCARYQAKPTEKHLTTVKRIFWYLKDSINMGLWYPKDTSFELTAFLDSDHAGCLDLRKSTSGGIQFLGGDKLVSWSSKKQDCTSMSSAEAEYVSLSACCAQVLWLRTQLTDYGFHFDKIPMYCDSKAAIAISCNPVQHSRTKHIDVRYHFIKEQVEKGIVELFFVGTEYQLADLFTKALSEDRFKYLVRRLGMRCLTPDELEVLAIESA